MLRRTLYWSSHYLLIGLYVLFALFPLFWLIKVALTPNDPSLPTPDKMTPTAQSSWFSQKIFLRPGPHCRRCARCRYLNSKICLHPYVSEQPYAYRAKIRPSAIYSVTASIYSDKVKA